MMRSSADDEKDPPAVAEDLSLAAAAESISSLAATPARLASLAARLARLAPSPSSSPSPSPCRRSDVDSDVVVEKEYSSSIEAWTGATARGTAVVVSAQK